MTGAERALWRLLRESFPKAHFRHQVPIRHYIADFASHRAKLVIEVDGGQHGDDVDAMRTAVIEQEGYRVIRFWNNDVLGNRDGVWTMIDTALHEHHPHQQQVELPPAVQAHAGGMSDLLLSPIEGEEL